MHMDMDYDKQPVPVRMDMVMDVGSSFVHLEPSVGGIRGCGWNTSSKL